MSKKEDEEDKKQNDNIELRRALNDAYAFIEGQKLTQSFSTVAFEELMDEQIQRIEGTPPPGSTKPNELDRITKMKAELVAAVEKIKALPNDAFKKVRDNNNVNTPPK